MKENKRVKENRKCKAILNEHKGSTMVETLVAFLVVVTMALMFSKVITVSANLLVSTQKIIDRNEEFNAYYYKISSDKNKPDTERKIALVLDQELTESSSNASPIEIQLMETKFKYCSFAEETMYFFDNK